MISTAGLYRDDHLDLCRRAPTGTKRLGGANANQAPLPPCANTSQYLFADNAMAFPSSRD